ncbi:MAG: HNH endonuclease [Actinomycetota bacterium]|nr:HNH endonuclease [Actinomycetota bacterium]
MTGATTLETMAERHGLVAVAEQLHHALDRAGGVGSGGLTADEHTGFIESLARAEARLGALKLRVLAAADARQVHRLTGQSGTDAWLARTTRTDRQDAARQVHLARELRNRSATQTALAEGNLQTEHALVVTDTLRKLPPGLSDRQRDRVEESLVAQARTMSPASLRRCSRRALETVEPDPETVDRHEDALLRDEEAAARDRASLVLVDNADGTVTGHFTVSRVAGNILHKILDAMTSPRRARLGAAQSQGGTTGIRPDWSHARGLAFTEILEHLPTDRLHGKTAATVVVTMGLESLRSACKAAGLDTGDVISAGEARRLACGAGIIPAVLGGQSQPLDLGRSRGLFSQSQRTALGLRQRTCLADGCQRPYAWCELHHDVPWSADGHTDLDRAVGLCSFHHQRIHDPAYSHARLPDGSLRFHRRT